MRNRRHPLRIWRIHELALSMGAEDLIVVDLHQKPQHPEFAVIYDFIKRQVYKLLERHGITEFLPKKTGDEPEKSPKTISNTSSVWKLYKHIRY